MKYVSDKYAGQSEALIEVPERGGFADMAKLKGDKETCTVVRGPTRIRRFIFAQRIRLAETQAVLGTGRASRQGRRMRRPCASVRKAG